MHGELDMDPETAVKQRQPSPNQRRPPSHRQGRRRRVLDSLTQPGVRLAIWQRELPEGLSLALLDWAWRYPAGVEDAVSVPPRNVESCLAAFHAEPWRQWLWEDLKSLTEDFSRLAAVKSCRVTFGPIRTDQCRKFHVDKLRMRLITTYAGPGTEWLPEGAVRRAALENPAPCFEQANREIVKHAGLVRHAQAGDVLIMKGAMGGAPGLVHRSPPIEHRGLLRVVLVLST